MVNKSNVTVKLKSYFSFQVKFWADYLLKFHLLFVSNWSSLNFKNSSADRLSHRFAEFVEGSSHLTQDEVMNYSQVDFDDDDDDSREGDEQGNASLTDDDSGDEIDLPEWIVKRHQTEGKMKIVSFLLDLSFEFEKKPMKSTALSETSENAIPAISVIDRKKKFSKH